MTDATCNVMMPDKGVPIKAWTKGVPLEDAARQQLLNVAQLPFIYKWLTMEWLNDGQHVANFRIEVRNGKGWNTVVEGGAIGHKDRQRSRHAVKRPGNCR